MKEELLKQFTARLIHYVDSAEIFLKGNVPDYIEQLLKYETYHQVSTLVAGFATITLLGIALVFLYKKLYANQTVDADSEIGFWFFSIVVSLLCVVWFTTKGMSTINTIVKINVAPKVYVVDYLRSK